MVKRRPVPVPSSSSEESESNSSSESCSDSSSDVSPSGIRSPPPSGGIVDPPPSGGETNGVSPPSPGGIKDGVRPPVYKAGGNQRNVLPALDVERLLSKFTPAEGVSSNASLQQEGPIVVRDGPPPSFPPFK
ncbi:hypothetical protein GEMRC1_005640 [Eukaryota sp. GEM-RC1]